MATQCSVSEQNHESDKRVGPTVLSGDIGS